ncbi:MAG: hypothetical protein J6A38_01425 [Clostridia bacterium]|nr:hypothetical protein [Clostridia bacterium]
MILENQTTRVKIKEYTYEHIPDPTVRNYIFGREMPDRNTIMNTYISSMNNILLISFFAIFSVWKVHKDDEERMEDEYGAARASAIHARRVNEVIEGIYCDNVLTQETISFIFTEILLEAKKNPESPFNQLIKGTVAATKFPKIAEIIRAWKLSYQNAETDMTLLDDLYRELLESLSVLKYLRFKEDNGRLLCEIDLPDGKSYSSDLSVFIKRIEDDDDNDVYYLYKANKYGNQVELEYMNFGGNTVYKDSTDTTGEFVKSKSAFQEITQNILDVKFSNDISKSLKINDFKYIHRLSLCVSDVLGEGTKRVVLAKIQEKSIYRDNFFNKNDDEINWDNIIVLLMLEDGPSETIETVLKSDINAFENILKSLLIRFNLCKPAPDGTEPARVTYKELLKEYKEREKLELIHQESMQSNAFTDHKIRDWIKNAQIFLMSQFIISKVAETEVKSEAFYAESIMMKKQKIDSIIKAHGAFAALSMINKTLERVFRTLILFYNGIIAYAKERERQFKNCTISQRHEDHKLKEIQKACEDAFFDCVDDKFHCGDRASGKTPIKEATLGMLINEFRELCLKMDLTKGKTTVYREEGMLLHSIIGRRKICDISIFNKLIEANKKDFAGIENYPTDLVAFFNKTLKHDDPTVNIKDSKIIDNYINQVKALFDFFNVNEDYGTKGKMAIQNIFDPIFPYVVRYSERNENRDRCSVCQYIINTDGGFEDTKIKLLTEYDYVMNELYYCIPNAECSTKNWWVSPFLISCRRFDDFILGYSKGNSI